MTSTSVPIIREAGQGETIYLSETWYQIWKVTGENTKGAADIWLEVVPPQMGPPEHLHDRYDEGFLVVKGTFLFKGAGSTVKVSEGAWIFIPGGVAHTFRNIGTENGQLLIEAFPGGGMSKFFKEISPILTSEPADQQALERINERYGVVIVGPPLAEEGLGR
ncbi:MAG: cupin domain-containing protein [Ktedonobacteraceae bacterium]|nr:cupin domain-containing protein [Ktedonobacteraceae bacterium]